jgi:hypothetical protein
VPFIYRAYVLLNYYRGINIFDQENGLDRIRAMLKATGELPAWKETDPGMDYLTTGYVSYGGTPTPSQPTAPASLSEL